MTDTTTNLTRLRARMLATAFSNADIWTRSSAFLTDQAVAALARCDRAAAEALAASLLAPEFLHDTQVLGAAVEAGIDTSTWEERRENIRAYAREAYELPASPTRQPRPGGSGRRSTSTTRRSRRPWPTSSAR
ncbi:hypothetical protein GCM10010103_65650 [Streptomyces paradoxus]|uniref:Uncharacterized protein n=1 Tax=Streptomyces paradoxus TaxID=66375 RepID=A0A7W9THU9_9ACTN|nr:hypothetical protein [Streptomyces paradoxus]MBB6081025.1 hypothetical protein [Streptomyces paradoxus]